MNHPPGPNKGAQQVEPESRSCKIQLPPTKTPRWHPACNTPKVSGSLMAKRRQPYFTRPRAASHYKTVPQSRTLHYRQQGMAAVCWYLVDLFILRWAQFHGTSHRISSIYVLKDISTKKCECFISNTSTHDICFILKQLYMKTISIVLSNLTFL